MASLRPRHSSSCRQTMCWRRNCRICGRANRGFTACDGLCERQTRKEQNALANCFPQYACRSPVSLCIEPESLAADYENMAISIMLLDEQAHAEDLHGLLGDKKYVSVPYDDWGARLQSFVVPDPAYLYADEGFYPNALRSPTRSHMVLPGAMKNGSCVLSVYTVAALLQRYRNCLWAYLCRPRCKKPQTVDDYEPVLAVKGMVTRKMKFMARRTQKKPKELDCAWKTDMVPGIADQTKAKLIELGINTVGELVDYLGDCGEDALRQISRDFNRPGNVLQSIKEALHGKHIYINDCRPRCWDHPDGNLQAIFPCEGGSPQLHEELMRVFVKNGRTADRKTSNRSMFRMAVKAWHQWDHPGWEALDRPPRGCPRSKSWSELAKLEYRQLLQTVRAQADHADRPEVTREAEQAASNAIPGPSTTEQPGNGGCNLGQSLIDAATCIVRQCFLGEASPKKRGIDDTNPLAEGLLMKQKRHCEAALFAEANSEPMYPGIASWHCALGLPVDEMTACQNTGLLSTDLYASNMMDKPADIPHSGTWTTHQPLAASLGLSSQEMPGDASPQAALPWSLDQPDVPCLAPPRVGSVWPAADQLAAVEPDLPPFPRLESVNSQGSQTTTFQGLASADIPFGDLEAADCDNGFGFLMTSFDLLDLKDLDETMENP